MLDSPHASPNSHLPIQTTPEHLIRPTATTLQPTAFLLRTTTKSRIFTGPTDCCCSEINFAFKPHSKWRCAALKSLIFWLFVLYLDGTGLSVRTSLLRTMLAS